MEKTVIEMQPVMEFRDGDYDGMRAEIFAKAEKFFEIEAFKASFRSGAIYTYDKQTGITEIHVSAKDEIVFIDFLVSKKNVRVYFIKGTGACCIGDNEKEEKTFKYDEKTRKITYRDYASAWDCLDYNDHRTEHEEFVMIYDTVTGECVTEKDAW